MSFIINSLDGILVAISAVISAASAVCAITPTAKDDTICAKIQSFLNVLALNVGQAKKA